MVCDGMMLRRPNIGVNVLPSKNFFDPRCYCSLGCVMAGFTIVDEEIAGLHGAPRGWLLRGAWGIERRPSFDGLWR